EEPDVQWKAAAFARWHEPDDARVSSPVLRLGVKFPGPTRQVLLLPHRSTDDRFTPINRLYLKLTSSPEKCRCCKTPGDNFSAPGRSDRRLTIFVASIAL